MIKATINMKKLLPLLMCILLICCESCKMKSAESMYESPFVIEIENITESIDLRLSELADSFSIIQLETTPEAIIGTSDFYVSDEYVLAYNQDGVYRFSPEGEFIKKLINVGPGPVEISRSSDFSVNESLGILLINDSRQHPSELLLYDLKSDRLLQPVKKLYPCTGQMFLTNDSLILGSFSIIDQSEFKTTAPYAIYYQNLKGELVSGIIHSKPDAQNERAPFKYVTILFDGTEYYANFYGEDTLFAVRNNTLIPSMIITYQKTMDDGAYLRDFGYFFCNYQFPGYIRIQKSLVTGPKIEFTWYLLDKSVGKTFIINSIIDDFVNSQIDPILYDRTFHYILSTNNRLILTYYPYQIREIIAGGQQNVNIPHDLWDQLELISRNIKDNDNPVLIVGKRKGT